MFFLSSAGADIKLVKEVARKTQMHLWPSADNPVFNDKEECPKKLYVIAHDMTLEKLSYLFSKCAGVIDDNAHKNRIVLFLKEQKESKHESSLSLLTTSVYIYQYDIAGLFSSILQKKRGFSDNRRQSIHLALHEALANSLLHGNLALSSTLRQTTQGVLSYCELIDTRLQQSKYKHKSVCICAFLDQDKMEIRVQDEGRGYALDKILKRTDTSITAKSGRGLQMIARAADSCTIENCGRKITLSFLRENEINKSIAEIPLDMPSKSDISDCCVLVIENDSSNQTLLAELLSQQGVHKIEIASTGQAGFEKALTQAPDLIILEAVSPQIDGYDILKRLRNTPLTHETPVLLVIPSDTREIRDRTFKAGACDFITKPINPLEFFARVRVHLENTKLLASLTNQLCQIKRELQTAQSMQHNLLPNDKQIHFIKEKYRLKVASHFSPSAQLGGDFWQIIPISQHRIGVYLCDFSGHGLASALNTFRMHTLIFKQGTRMKIDQPADFLKRLNNQLYQLLERGQFATFFFGIFDTKAHTLSYTGAGVPPPFLRNKKGIRLLETRGLPLGIKKDSFYENYCVPFNSGDKILLYSDALIENKLKDGTRPEVVGFLKMVRPFFNLSASSALKALTQTYEALNMQPIEDDVTMVLVEGE